MSSLNPQQVCEVYYYCSHFTDKKTEAERGVSRGRTASKLQSGNLGPGNLAPAIA